MNRLSGLHRADADLSHLGPELFWSKTPILARRKRKFAKVRPVGEKRSKTDPRNLDALSSFPY